MVGKISRVPLREVWPRGETEFTRWLRDNIDVLNEAINVTLTGAESEQPAGKFFVDIVAEDENGNIAIIENQFEKSDHDHLGKLLTYMVAREAKTIAWVVADPRPEHISVVTWLNESTDASFYMFKVEAIQIGDSDTAPLLTLIVGPTEEAREVGESKKEWAERHSIRHDFWSQLLERIGGRTSLHTNIRPSRDGWISTGAGRSGLSLTYSIREHNGQVELYIDRGNQEENKAIFDQILEKKEEIEHDFGGPLDWQRLDAKRASRIRKVIDLGGYRDQDRWPEIQDIMIDAMIHFNQALKKHIEALDM